MIDKSPGRRIFNFINTIGMIAYALVCIFPMLHILALSLSSTIAVSTGRVSVWPVDFTLKSYEYILNRPQFWDAMGVSILRVVLGVSVNMLMVVIAAYPLSKSVKEFKPRTAIVWFFVFTMLFSGGMIPSYMIVRNTRLINSIWALILPGAVPVFNLILMINFFKSVPKEMEESAFMDGAGYFRILWQIYIPLSMASIATIAVFAIVNHWNSWFDGMIYMNDARKYPMQTYLQSILVQPNVRQLTKAQAELMRRISDRTIKASQVFIAAIPVLLVYPFMQRYFVKGIMLGSVKE